MICWSCKDCHMSNLTAEDGYCRKCGGRNKHVLQPVRETNQMQNSPPYDELVNRIDSEEANRQTTESIDRQIADLIARWRLENGRIDD